MGMEEFKLLDAVTASGVGAAKNVPNAKNISLYYAATGVTTGATVQFEALSPNGDWHIIDQQVIGATGLTVVRLENTSFLSVRGNVSAYTDGTYTLSTNAQS